MHYVCLADWKLYEKPGVCIKEDCHRFGMPLAECECTDGQHKSAMPPEAEKDQRAAKA